mmetsp:Transcript_85749/g.142760  ORF Transcript_85749/g.142760 Transcript_85749/m.142760 type:complete len:218 (-) Transcript_85749:13-666(-)
MAVGISKDGMTSSGMLSKCLQIARILFPCAPMIIRFPAFRAGAISPSQRGRTRAIVSFKDSVSGISLGSKSLYFASWIGWYWLDLSRTGGGMSKLRRQINTCSVPCFATVSFLSNPARPPYIRSFSLQLEMWGIQAWSMPFRQAQSVWIARFKTELYAMSNSRPASFKALPPASASFRPLSLRSTSTQPVNLFSWFHVDSPWRTRTSVAGICTSEKK